MKKFFAIPVLAFLILFAGSCSNDIDTNADWKEILVVYGLLNKADSNDFHYIRVNKAFLSENQSALEIAKINDSLYFDTSIINVTIEEYNGNNIRQAFHLVPKVLNKDTGMFANYPNFVYAFSGKIDEQYTYKLIIHNKKSGKYTTAETKLVDDPTPGSPSHNTSNFLIDTSKNIILSWTAGKSAKVYDMTMRFYWDEYDSATNQLLDSNVFMDWPMVQGRDVPVSGAMRSNIPGDNFYKYIAEKIPGITGKYRIPKKIDFLYWAGDNEFYLYRNVNQPSIGLVQKKPEYTNISNGNYGIFASRNYYIIPNVTIATQTKVFLQIYSITRHLKFRS